MNHYDCLKVTPDAPTEVIRAAYRALAGKRHPDRQGGTMGRDDQMHDQMVAINAAYEVLINPDLRAEYDASLLAAKAKAKPAAGNSGKTLDVAEGGDGFSETRVDIDWITPKPSGPTPLWPLTPNRKYAAMASCVLLMAFAIWAGWSVVSRHQMDKALSDQYSTHALENMPGEDQMASVTDIRPTPEAPPVLPRPPEVAETPEAVLAAEQGVPPSSPQPPPPSFERQPTVTELSKLSDEELMAILPSLGELQPAKGSFSRQMVSTTHHPLDGKPLNLRQERHLVDPLAAEARPKR